MHVVLHDTTTCTVWDNPKGNWNQPRQIQIVAIYKYIDTYYSTIILLCLCLATYISEIPAVLRITRESNAQQVLLGKTAVV